MKELKISEAAKAAGGRYTSEGVFTGVYTDSRKPLKGGLFIALEGEKFDGHDFIENAEKDGAAAVMCRKEVKCSIPVIYVNDTKAALLKLAAYYRSLFSIPVIGLTGSVGKTTTKEMTALVASSVYRTVKTQGNLNNEIGMPMTIFNIDDTTQAAVIEMGMNHFGEISRLTAVSKPDAAIITNIGVSHIENLGSRENILKAKLEILEGMKEGSPLILNGDNDLLKTVKNEKYKIIFFGIENDKADITASDIEENSEGISFCINYKGKKYNTYVPSPGIHNVYNALAAFGAGVAIGVPEEKAAEALKNYVPSGMRQKITSKGGITFIEDCYNASPDSVKAGINTLKGIKASRHIAVLGDMLELGDFSSSLHSRCGKYAAEKGVDLLFTYGEASGSTANEAEKNGLKAYRFLDEKQLVKALVKELKAGDAVLFKASRGMKLENVINGVYEVIDNN